MMRTVRYSGRLSCHPCPLPYMAPCHTCPPNTHPTTMHAPPTMYTPLPCMLPRPRTPPFSHTRPPSPRTPPSVDRQTLVKTLDLLLRGVKIFPTAITVKSNKPIISRRHYLLESLLAHLKVT